MRKKVLWGHHVAEYMDMFDLSKSLTGQKVLEFGCGPTTVNQELSQQGIEVQSCDPWFESDVAPMKSKFVAHFDQQVERMRTHPERFNFDKYGGMDTFIAKRQQGMEAFFVDYPKGFEQSRYQSVNDIKLPYANASFDLALCSNYLFADLPEQDVEFHLAWINELTRVATELRCYPLTDQQGQVSELLGPVLLVLQQQGFQVAIEEVPFRLVPASKAMLKIRSGRCQL